MSESIPQNAHGTLNLEPTGYIADPSAPDLQVKMPLNANIEATETCSDAGQARQSESRAIYDWWDAEMKGGFDVPRPAADGIGFGLSGMGAMCVERNISVFGLFT